MRVERSEYPRTSGSSIPSIAFASLVGILGVVLIVLVDGLILRSLP